MSNCDALILKPNKEKDIVVGIPDDDLFANMGIDLLNFRYFEDSVGVYRGDWSVEIGENIRILSLMLDVHEEWDYEFASQMTLYSNIEVTGFEYLKPSVSSKNEDVLELRILVHSTANINKGEYHAWPLSRFYSPSLDRNDEFNLLDFWSLMNTKAEQQV